MIRSATFVLLLVCAVGLPGCQKQDAAATATPRTAVIDLDGVAKAVGRMEQITEQLDSAMRQLNLALQEAAAEIQAEYNLEKGKLGETPSDEDKQRLAQIAARAQQVLTNNKAVAQTRHAQVRAHLIQQFRGEIQPLTEKVARQRGYDVVLVSSPNLVWYDPKLDITGAVIEAYKQDPPKPATATPAPAPTDEAQGPPTLPE